MLLIGRIEVNDLPQAAACGVRALLYRHLATPERIVSTIGRRPTAKALCRVIC